MGNPATIPMLDPSGQARMIPAEQQQAALQAGGKLAVKIVDPQGTPRWIPQDQQQQALQAGGKLFDQPQQQPSMLARAGSFVTSLPGVQEGIGFGKEGERSLAGLMQILGTPNGAAGLATGQDPRTMVPTHVQHAADWLNKNTEADGLWQHVGAFAENVAEFLTPEALASLAKGSEVLQGDKAAQAATNAAKLADASKVAQVLDKYPRLKALVGVGMSALRSGAEAGTQTYVKTGGDATQAGEAALIGGAAGAVPGVVTQGVKAAAERLARPALTRDAVSEAAQGVVSKRLAETNATRTPTAQPNAPAEPYTFHIQGPPTQESVEGQIAQQPRKQQVGTRVISGKGPSERQVWIDPATNVPHVQDIHQGNTDAPGSHRAPSYRLSEESKPGQVPAHDVASGGGTLLTQDPKVAAAHLQSLDTLMRSPEFGAMKPELRQAYRAMREDIRSQIAEHYQSTKLQGTNTPNFKPVNIPQAIEQSGSFRDAAEQLRQAGAEVYEHANDVSGGQWQTLKDSIDEAQSKLASTADISANRAERAGYARKIAQMESKMRDILETPSNGIDRDDAQQAIRNMHAHFVLKEAHEAIKPLYAIEDQASSLSSYGGFSGNRLASRFNEFLQRRPDAREILGQDRIDTLQHIFKQNDTNAGRKKFANAILTIGSALAGGAAHGWEGAAIGEGAYQSARLVMDSLVSNPKIAKSLLFALDSGARPEYYGPHLAEMITRAQAAGRAATAAAASNVARNQ